MFIIYCRHHCNCFRPHFFNLHTHPNDPLMLTIVLHAFCVASSYYALLQQQSVIPQTTVLFATSLQRQWSNADKYIHTHVVLFPHLDAPKCSVHYTIHSLHISAPSPNYRIHWMPLIIWKRWFVSMFNKKRTENDHFFIDSHYIPVNYTVYECIFFSPNKNKLKVMSIYVKKTQKVLHFK